MTEAPSLARKTVLNSICATLVAILLVAGINLYFVMRYQPQFTATAELTLWTYDNKHRQDSSDPGQALKAADIKEARELVGLLLPRFESRAKSSDGMQAAENACRAEGLTMEDYQPSQFNDRVSIQQVGTTLFVTFSCDDAKVAASVANSLAHWSAAKLGANAYDKTYAYYSEAQNRLAALKTNLEAKKNTLVTVKVMAQSDPKFQNETNVPEKDFDKMKSLATEIQKKYVAEVLTTVGIEALARLEKDNSPLFDAAEVKRLKETVESLVKDREEKELEIQGLWKKIAKDDLHFPRIQNSELEKYKAEMAVAKLAQSDEPGGPVEPVGPIAALKNELALQVTALAEPPEAPSAGQPALTMILLCGLAIAVPYLLAFLLSRRAEDAAVA